ncbi:MAG: YbfB/YjiJ family MFS transporter [Comamonas sp.]|nr:YbfB/YjiJ family MFS transporter [Comamonas sp.]
MAALFVLTAWLPFCFVTTSFSAQRTTAHILMVGFMATFSGTGLARFAYTALMPQMVLSGWLSGEQAAFLGATNLLGYLLGALTAATAAQRLGARTTLLLCWWATVLSFAASSWPQAPWVLASWRFVAGVCGAMLMVLGPSVAMAAAAPERRAVLGPLMFCGVGAGALLSATVIPLLLDWGLGWLWLALAGLSALAALAGQYSSRPDCLPSPPVVVAQAPSSSSLPAPQKLWTGAVVLLLLAYALDGFGYVPHTVFWVDYLGRELGLSTAYTSVQWALFGVGAMLGPALVAVVAPRWGWGRSMGTALLLKTGVVALPLLPVLGNHWALHSLSSFAMGALTPAVVSMASGYVMFLVGVAAHRRMWGYATATFALAQAISGYSLAALYAYGGTYLPLFAIGSVCLLAAALLIGVGQRVTRQDAAHSATAN